MINTELYDQNAPINVYVANIGKYNEGELVGGWISLPRSEEEIEDFLRGTVGINDEYEEYAIHDWESNYFEKISECESIDSLNEKAEIVDGLNIYEEKTAKAAIEIFGDEFWLYSIDDFVLYDEVHTEYDLGYYWAVDSGCYDLGGSVLSRYFDYEAFGRDIDLETNGGFSSYGYIELRN